MDITAETPTDLIVIEVKIAPVDFIDLTPYGLDDDDDPMKRAMFIQRLPPRAIPFLKFNRRERFRKKFSNLEDYVKKGFAAASHLS